MTQTRPACCGPEHHRRPRRPPASCPPARPPRPRPNAPRRMFPRGLAFPWTSRPLTCIPGPPWRVGHPSERGRLQPLTARPAPPEGCSSCSVSSASPSTPPTTLSPRYPPFSRRWPGRPGRRRRHHRLHHRRPPDRAAVQLLRPARPGCAGQDRASRPGAPAALRQAARTSVARAHSAVPGQRHQHAPRAACRSCSSGRPSALMYLLFRSTSIGGAPNGLLAHYLFAAQLGSHWLGGTGRPSARGRRLCRVVPAAGRDWCPGRPGPPACSPRPRQPGRRQPRPREVSRWRPA